MHGASAGPGEAGGRPRPNEGAGDPAEVQMGRRSPTVRDSRLAAFLERNKTSSSVELRRQTAKLQKTLVQETRQDSDVLLWGSMGTPGFRKMLKSHYGSVAAAFRVGLDKDGNGVVSFGELVQCCREIGFTGNLKKLWTELDVNGDGGITLNELDADACAGLDEFRELCLDRFGSTLSAWNEHLNKEGTVGVSEKKFVERCKSMGYSRDASALFSWLKVESHRKELTLRDIDPQTASAILRADPRAESISMTGGHKAGWSHMPSRASLSPSGSPLARRGSALARCEALVDNGASLRGSEPQSRAKRRRSSVIKGTGTPEARLTDAGEEDSAPASPASAPTPPAAPPPTTLSLASAAALLAARTSEPDSPPAALSAGSRLKKCVSSPAFQAVRALQKTPSATRNSKWFRDLSLVQRALIDERERALTQADIGMKTAAELKEHLIKQYGSLSAGWRRAIDPQGMERVGRLEFCERLRAVGYQGKLDNDLFTDLGVEDGFVRLRHFDPEADAVLQRFRAKLRQKYGNMLSAWKWSFDSSGFCKEEDFVRKCAEEGIEGDASALFRLLQPDPSKRAIGLYEFDPAAMEAALRNDHEMITRDHEKTSKLAQTFEERQSGTVSNRWSQAQGKDYRATVHSVGRQSIMLDMGCEAWAELKTQLMRKFGTLRQAWCALDASGKGKFSFEDFCKVLRDRVGYIGDYKKLWSELDPERRGHITLYNFDPDAAAALDLLRDRLTERFGNTIAGWQEGIDAKHTGRVEEGEFISRCVSALGYSEPEARTLFEHVRTDRHRKHVTLADVDQLAVEAKFRGDPMASTLKRSSTSTRRLSVSLPTSPMCQTASSISEGLAAEQPATAPTSPAAPGFDGNATFPGAVLRAGTAQGTRNEETRRRHTRGSQWMGQLGKQQKALVEKTLAVEKAAHMDIKSHGEFQRDLAKRYGSTVAAWRGVLDPEGLGRLPFGLFCDAVARVGFTGNVKQLWQQLDSNQQGQVTLKDLDPCAQAAIDVFREALLQKHSSLMEAWDQALDPDGGRKLEESQFLERCGAMKLSLDDQKLQKVFRMMLPMRSEGRKQLMEEDMGVLLLGMPRSEQLKAWAGDCVPTPSSPSSPKSKAGLMAFGRMSVSGPPPQAAAQPNELPTHSVEDFKRLLTRMFGSVYSGWRKRFDISGKDRVQILQFVQRAKELGVNGNAKELFQALDKQGRGYITMEDVDPEAAQAVSSFLEVAEQNGGLEDMWQQSIDVGKKGRVSCADFVSGCARIGYEGDAALLFRCLKPEKGRPFLCIEDFGRRRAHGECSPPSSPTGRRRSDGDVSQPTSPSRRGAGSVNWTQSPSRSVTGPPQGRKTFPREPPGSADSSTSTAAPGGFPSRPSTSNDFWSGQGTGSDFPARPGASSDYQARPGASDEFPARPGTSHTLRSRGGTRDNLGLLLADALEEEERQVVASPDLEPDQSRPTTSSDFPARPSTSNAFPSRPSAGDDFPPRPGTSDAFPSRSATRDNPGLMLNADALEEDDTQQQQQHPPQAKGCQEEEKEEEAKGCQDGL